MEFNCSLCNVTCAHKCDYDRHLNTAKHKQRMNSNASNASNAIGVPSVHGCDICGKTYKFRSGLSIHKKTHVQHKSYDSSMATVIAASATQDKHFSDLIGVVKDLMAHNKEVVSQNKDMINQNKVLVDAIQTKMANDSTLALTLAGSGLGNRITNNTNNITNNTQFNLQLFLNTDCKDAINLSDFVKTLKITLQDLEFTKTNGIVEGVSSIIVNNLKGMDVHKRPIHCTDLKRETMYVKNDEWIKDDMHEHINKFIYLTSCYQTRVIQDWMNAHPGWETKERMHTEYHNICKELYKKIEHDERANKKIIKAFLKEVHLAKNGAEMV
jgi:hypothetical protein